MLGGFSPLDGTIEFYGRINAFLKSSFVVVDLGAGRGGWFADGDVSDYQRSLRLLKGKVSKVIGVDVDESVLSNASTDENFVMEAGRIPLADASVDVVIADFVLEHLGDPEGAESEVFRVLRSGGLFCARTPHALNYVCVGARLAGRRSADVLKAAQPARQHKDTFARSTAAIRFVVSGRSGRRSDGLIIRIYTLPNPVTTSKRDSCTRRFACAIRCCRSR